VRATLAGLTATAALLILAPAEPAAWGMDVHRWITGRALDGLSGGPADFFQPARTFISEHSVDPDLWRVVDLEGERGPEPPNHFLDIDALDEPAPFTGVPREWDAYVARYGGARADRSGRLPWQVTDVYDRLVTALTDARADRAPYAADNARYLAAVLAHYVEDAFVPFHAVANYDGQLTGQRGIHARFETVVVLRNRSRIQLAPVRIAPIPDGREFIFETLVDGTTLVPGVLEADRAALSGDDHDDAYYATFFDGTRPVIERRLSDAASAVASLLAQAWQDSAPEAETSAR